MNFKLSPKYKPLFELLRCWEVINSTGFYDLKQERQDYWDSLAMVDTVLISGGRESGKTFAETIFIPIAVRDYNHRVLLTRYTMNSTDHSVSSALDARIEALNMIDNFEFSGNTYTSKTNEGKIAIQGQKTSSLNQTAKLKSLEDFSMFITDEGDEMKSFEEWDKIKKSIRAKDVQCLNLIVFNPPSKAHFLYTEFYEERGVDAGFNGVKENILYIHTDYRDNIEHIAPHNLRAFEKLGHQFEEYESLPNEAKENCNPRLKKGWRKYKSVVLGGFLDVAEGVIYEDWEIGEFDDTLPFVYGLDFGFSDPDALTKVAVNHDKKLIHIKEEYFKNGTSTDALAEIVVSICGHDGLIVGDSAQARLINDLYHKHGLNIIKALKGAGSVEKNIKEIQGYTLVITPDSYNIVKAVNNYVWKSQRAGVPDHAFSDLCDSFRYAFSELARY